MQQISMYNQEKPKFGAVLRNTSQLANSSVETRAQSSVEVTTNGTLNTSVYGGSTTSNVLNQSMFSSANPLSGSKKSMNARKTEERVSKSMQNNRESIEEENENAGSSETDSPD